ncbi:hypothetical protein CHS0354_029762 [Potamilus streckersoni]|uniref:unspecific monooxygenase n=1 Tax=Potamilus streckersoni TaxID=2493646 RepID=A0AAE0TH46_9BIVA|nr:hypothetical protein CHS0354_029762 [Potamilus streckersoni]
MSATIILLFTAIISLYLIRLKRSRKPSSTAPGPYSWPVLGNLLSLGRKPHLTLTKMRETYRDVYQIMLGSCPTIILNGLQTIKQALVKQAEDFAGRPNFYSFKYIANGKSMGFGDYGAQHCIISEGHVLTQHLFEMDNEPFNPHNEIYLSVGNIICALCFGKLYKRDDSDFLQLVKNNDEFMAFAGAGNPVDIMPFIAILETMDAFCLKKQKEHLKTYEPSNVRDITDALIKAARETPEEKKKAEMIGAGFDTISSTLQWSILYMITNPEIQEKVHQELKNKYGFDKDPDFADLKDLPFTEAVLLETMRHSCIFPMALPHSATKDTTINGNFVKDKTLVFGNLWSISHDPNNFPKPDIYDPYRFLEKDSMTVNRTKAEQFLPFGTGRRKCPGKLLAWMEIFYFFTIMIQKCKFSKAPGENPVVDCKYGLTLKPLDFNVMVSKRT